MASPQSWFSRRTLKGIPRNRANAQGNSQENRIIRGRVTKPLSSGRGKAFEESIDTGSLAMAGQAEGDGGVLEPTKKVNKQPLPPRPRRLRRIRWVGPPIGLSARSPRIRDLSGEDRSRPSTPAETLTEEDTLPDYDPKEGWRYEQVYLNHILKARNEYTLMPSTWRMHFRGIPLPEGLFYAKTQNISARPRIYARTDRLEYRGTTELRKLMDIHARVRDLRKAQTLDPKHEYGPQIVRHIVQRLEGAMYWAGLDGDLFKYRNALEPNITILEMNDSDRLDMDAIIQDDMSALANKWRASLRTLSGKQQPDAPVLFAFVVFKHILFIVTLDAQNPDALCHIPCQLNLSEYNQHQWNALAIMATICWARDLFMDLAGRLPDVSEEETQSSDPDV